MARPRRRRSSRRHSTQRLLRIALRHYDSDRAWNAIRALHFRGSAALVVIIEQLARNRRWRCRSVGLSIAAQLQRCSLRTATGGAAFAVPRTQALLIAGLHDAHAAVVDAAAAGIGHRFHIDALPRLVELARHPDCDIRFDVAFALGAVDDARAREVLMALAGDADADVRDWATFGLGTLQREIDSPEIRETLWRNLHDVDRDVRAEALCGLAVRGDERALAGLLARLDDDVQVCELAAAETLADPILLPSLRRLAVRMEGCGVDRVWRGGLRDAIAACERGGGPVPSSA